MAEVGRPTVMTPETIHKLEEGFTKGFTDREASLYADIAPSTLYKYCEENPEFSERKELLKDSVKLRAKTNLVEAINAGDRGISQWYLERKAKDEFAQRSEHTGKEGEAITFQVVSFDEYSDNPVPIQDKQTEG
jgi:hypothetical protein